MIGIVILNYNKWKLVINCIDSIRDTYYKKNYHIYVVDNGSKNESLKFLEKEYQMKEFITIIGLDKNIGFAAGNNAGCRRAIQDGCDILLVTNSDILFEKNSIEYMIEEMNQCMGTDLVFPCILNQDRSIQQEYILVGKQNMMYDLFFAREKVYRHCPEFIKKRYYKNVAQCGTGYRCNMFFGCCFMIRSESFMQVGLFDEHTFLYYEENILAYKLTQNHKKMCYMPESRVLHLCGASSNSYEMKKWLKKSRFYYMKEIKKHSNLLCSIDRFI